MSWLQTDWLVHKEITSPKGFSASKCDVGNWIFSKSLEFFEKLFGNFLSIFGEFPGRFLGRNFWGEIFWKDFFGRIFWEESFVYVGIDLFVKILVFVKILSQSTRKEEEEFQSLEVREQAPSHLIIVKIWVWWKELLWSQIGLRWTWWVKWTLFFCVHTTLLSFTFLFEKINKRKKIRVVHSFYWRVSPLDPASYINSIRSILWFIAFISLGFLFLCLLSHSCVCT